MNVHRKLRSRIALAIVFLPSVAAAEPVWNAQSEGEWELAPGLRLLRREWTVERQRGMLCALFADPARHELKLLTAAAHGGRRRPAEWLEDFELVAVINAAMFQPNGRSTAMMIDGELINNGYDHPNYGGYLAFQPRGDRVPVVQMLGRDCEGFDLARLRSDYAAIVQNYRLLDCEGQPIVWRDRRSYPATAIGVSERGEVVLVHSGGALEMHGFAKLLREQLGLRSAVFTEGGPQAALSIRFERRDLHLGGIGEGPVRSLPLVLGLSRP